VTVAPTGLNVHLTPRERELCALLAAGVTTNAELAAAMCISDNTVGYHLRGIYAALDVHSRAQATLWAVRHSLVR
jgi:DNA-binding CsgD family transcriptional regulator